MSLGNGLGESWFAVLQGLLQSSTHLTAFFQTLSPLVQVESVIGVLIFLMAVGYISLMMASRAVLKKTKSEAVVSGEHHELEDQKKSEKISDGVSEIKSESVQNIKNIEPEVAEDSESLAKIQREIAEASRLAAQMGMKKDHSEHSEYSSASDSLIKESLKEDSNIFNTQKWSEIVKQTFQKRTQSALGPRNNASSDTRENNNKNRANASRLEGFFAVYLVPNRGASFYGSSVLKVLTRLGLRFGDRAIFHKFDDHGRKLFSLAQSVEPGGFDFNQMPLSLFKGFVCFFDLASVHSPKLALRSLLASAHELAHELDAKLLNQWHQPLTQAGITEVLQRIKQAEASVELEKKTTAFSSGSNISNISNISKEETVN